MIVPVFVLVRETELLEREREEKTMNAVGDVRAKGKTPKRKTKMTRHKHARKKRGGKFCAVIRKVCWLAYSHFVVE
jgi:hypothetical protein